MKHALILAGGRGTRFWPRSRAARAKQVLSLFGERSLIQATVDRLAPAVPASNIWILTNDQLRAEIVRQLPEVPPGQILSEPAARNTAPAIALAARLVAEQDPRGVLGVFPADHVITKPKPFLKLVKAAYKAAAGSKITVLGIGARSPETGFGYIELPEGFEPGALTPLPVLSFQEKPQRERAEAFIASGRYCWNAGMFFGQVSAFTEAFTRYLPATAELLEGLPPFASRKFKASLARVFPQCENISIDYAIMEPAAKAGEAVGLAAGDIGWNDVGSWTAVRDLLPSDIDGNVAQGDVLLLASRGNYVGAEAKLVALLGVSDLIIVDTPDALLVAHKDRAQQVGEVVKQLEARGRRELL
jgi:mannose-1-phosphate guanylyltransferase